MREEGALFVWLEREAARRYRRRCTAARCVGTLRRPPTFIAASDPNATTARVSWRHRVLSVCKCLRLPQSKREWRRDSECVLWRGEGGTHLEEQNKEPMQQRTRQQWKARQKNTAPHCSAPCVVM